MSRREDLPDYGPEQALAQAVLAAVVEDITSPGLVLRRIGSNETFHLVHGTAWWIRATADSSDTYGLRWWCDAAGISTEAFLSRILPLMQHDGKTAGGAQNDGAGLSGDGGGADQW